MSNIDDKLSKLIQIKSDIKDAIVDKGVEMPAGLPFDQYSTKIGEISGGVIPTTEDYKIFKYEGSNYSTYRSNISEDGIFTSSLDDKGLSLNVFPGDSNLPDDGTGFLTVEMKVRINEISTTGINLIFGCKNNFALGFNATNPYFGIWAGAINGDQTGITDLPVETGKDYYFRVTPYSKSGSFAYYIKLEVKYAPDEDYITIGDFNSYQKAISTGGDLDIGWCYYSNATWYSSCSIDLKTVNAYGKLKDSASTVFIKCT